MQPHVPAVVILGQLNGLGIIRSLGRGGVKSHVVDRTRSNAGMWSRYSYPVLSTSLEGHELIDTLLKLQPRLGDRAVLFNSHEMAVITLSEHRNKLAGAFRFRLPAHDTVLALQDKARFHELAARSGLPVPRGDILRTSGDLSKLRAFQFPVVVKPADKGLVHSGKAHNVVVYKDFKNAAAGCGEMLERMSEILVQEWVEGANNQIYFCLFYRGRGGTTVSMFTGRKLASNPPNVGLTAFCMTAPDARETLEHMTESFLDKVDYAGMGSVEYKWDVNNQKFVIIEPTVGRTDWQEEIATLCGVNIPLDAYRHELDLPPARRVAPRNDIVWQASIFDRLKIGRSAVPADAIVYDGYWRLDDPMPGVIKYSWGTCSAGARKLQGYAGAVLTRKYGPFVRRGV